MCLKSTSEPRGNKMCLFFKPRKDIFKEVERVDAEITARDNERLKKEKENANNPRNEWGYPVVLPKSGTEGGIGNSQSDLHMLKVGFCR